MSGAVRIWALLALLAGLSLAPAHPGLAEPASRGADSGPADTRSTSALVRPQQVVALNSDGYIQAYGLSNGELVLLWQSSTGGWGNFILADMDGDSMKEIVAASAHVVGQYDKMAIFEPAAGTAPVATAQLPSLNYVFHLLTAGNFEVPDRDQVVYTFTYTDAYGFHEMVMEWRWTGSQWAILYISDYGAVLQDAAAGDVNRDGLADLVLVRNIDHMLKVFSDLNGSWSNLFQQQSGYATDWQALAVGKVVNNSSYPGNEIVATRAYVDSTSTTEVLFWWQGIQNMLDLTPSSYVHGPSFTQVALANLNGNAGGFKQILGLRDPLVGTSPFVWMLDPVNFGLPPFQPAGDYGAAAWKQIAAGDVDADGRDEVVILRDGTYSALRVYDRPDIDTHSLADLTTPGGYSAAALAVGNLGLPTSDALGASPTSLSFGAAGCGQASPVRTIAVFNPGGSPLPWQAATTTPWIHLSKTSGTTPDNIPVAIDISQTVPGTNTGTVQITAYPGVPNPSPEISVQFERVLPVLAATPGSVSLLVSYGRPGSAPVQLTNGASGAPISWAAAPGGGGAWLQASPAAGVTPALLHISVNGADIGVGTHTGTVSITGQDACGVAVHTDVAVAATVGAPLFLPYLTDRR